MTQAQNTAISMKILQQMLNNFDLNFTSDYAVSFEPDSGWLQFFPTYLIYFMLTNTLCTGDYT